MPDDGHETVVESNFDVYPLTSRATRTTGSAHDATQRRIDDALRIAKRYVYLEQTVLPSRNLTTFV